MLGLAVVALLLLVWIHRDMHQNLWSYGPAVTISASDFFRGREGYLGQTCVDHYGRTVPCDEPGAPSPIPKRTPKMQEPPPPYGLPTQTAPLNCQKGADGRCM